MVRSEDKLEDEEVMKTNTAKKMLSIFRQMEENATKEDVPDGKLYCLNGLSGYISFFSSL